MPTGHTVDGKRHIGPLSHWPASADEKALGETIPQLLARRCAEHGDAAAFYWPHGSGLAHMTYSELSAAATTVGAALAGLAEPGERIAVWSRNSVEWVLLEYGCALAGLIVTPLNAGWTDTEVSYAVELTDPAAIFVGFDHRGTNLVTRAAAIPHGKPVFALDDLRDWAARTAQSVLPVVAPDDPFLIQFTSGTTGRAKGAVLTQRAVLNVADLRNRHDVIGDNDVWLNPVPYHHVGGSCFVILGGLVSAGAFIVLESYSATQTLALLEHRVVTRIGGVPTMVTDALEHLGDNPRRAGIRSVSLGAAIVTQHLVDRIKATLATPVVITYGQSECPAITSTNIDDDSATVAGTIGRPVPGADVRIADPESGTVVPVGLCGEIQVRSRCVMRGYWGMPEQTAESFTEDGFLRTGDLGAMDERGYVTFRGRARDVIIRGGENIYPAEVEGLLVAHPGVADAVLVGVDDERLGEIVAGVVVRTPGSTVTGAQLAEYLNGSVARFKIPALWRFVAELPLTSSGKVKRFVIRDDTNAEFAGRIG
ncbi:class I adenylate-forming enzyme family protein [Mycobacterium branderi]|uniref:AMP-binding protein n=1 Tax=Mycobacterium branderi TaxID=43348 RepID=A0A7I7WIC7_9MYCO|nr:class I adenylate-forming enzyme family protein [Mycobacterium branderi]MCV7231750.1 acyl--CoA ligase [Mycobacterium branderi]ORA40283.1 hypothetical protein BST20_06955 [Mycobacterium branderi]BBZ15598.1 AMP-binding protein [Mycobacterium branderi]